MKINVGDIITFYATGYNKNGKWCNKPIILHTSKVLEIYNSGVRCSDMQEVKTFDYIDFDEIISINGVKVK